MGGNYLLSGCKSNTGVHMTFTPEDVGYLDEIADTILPTTSTPGAKAAKVGQFMTVMVNDCYDETDQKIFHEGIKKLDEASTKKFSNSSNLPLPSLCTLAKIIQLERPCQ